MVEGDQIDWAGHDNDIVGAMSEMKDFEKAYKRRSHLPKRTNIRLSLPRLTIPPGIDDRCE